MYMLFAGSSYYPQGGMLDFVGRYETLAEALEAAANLKNSDWWHVVIDDEIVNQG